MYLELIASCVSSLPSANASSSDYANASCVCDETDNAPPDQNGRLCCTILTLSPHTEHRNALCLPLNMDLDCLALLFRRDGSVAETAMVGVVILAPCGTVALIRTACQILILSPSLCSPMCMFLACAVITQMA